MSNQYRENPLGYQPIHILLRKFAIPSIIAMVVSALYNIVDQIFIGHGVGYLGNAATNVSFPLTTICLAFALTIGIGSATRYSLSLGRGDRNAAAETVGTGLAMMLVAGIVYTILVELFLHPLMLAFGAQSDIMTYALSYSGITALGMPFVIVNIGLSHMARADGSPKFSMNCMMLGAAINTILDPIFIFIFHMGVAGAAIATIISQIISCFAALSYLKLFKQISFKPSLIRLRPSVAKSIAALGMSNGLNQIAMTFVQIILNNSLTYYGASSIFGASIPLAACGVVMKTNAILFSVIIGISQGCLPILGFNYGARQYDRVIGTFTLAVKWNLIISTIAFLGFQLFPSHILALFGTGDKLYMEFAVLFMRIFLLMIIVNGVQMLSANLFSAIGKPMKGLALSLTRQVIFLIPLLLILPHIWGIYGVLYAAPVADFLSFCLTTFMVWREIRLMHRMEAKESQPNGFAQAEAH